MRAYYDHGGIALYHGDCREILPALGNVGADCVIADPPYGDTALDWDRWPAGWVDAVGAAAKPNAGLWCFGSMRMFLSFGAEFNAWNLSQDIIWEKNNGSGFDADRFRRIHEHALLWYRGAWRDVFHAPVMVPYAKSKKVAMSVPPAHRGASVPTTWERAPGDPVMMTSVIRVASAHGYATNETQKPEGLVRPLVQYACPPGGLVLSPFAGSGTDLVVARERGLRAIGIEAREEQCEDIVRRLGQQVLPWRGAA